MDYNDLFLIIALSLVVTSGMPIKGTQNDSISPQKNMYVEVGTVTDWNGVEYRILFNSLKLMVKIEANNPNSETFNINFGINVDSRRHSGVDTRLKNHQSKTFERDISVTIDVTRELHTVTFSTFGNETKFNFTRKINSTNPGPIPVPHITDVRVANGTVDGESSTVAYVTVANPSNQLYPTKLLVHTVETGGGLYGASVRPGENRTIKVELLEERGLQIAGEARLYVGEPSEREDALDQVEFVGRAGEETAVYNRSYRPITPPWRNDPYTYENGSISSADDGLFGTGFDLSADDVPAFAYLGAAVVVVLGLLLRRRT